MTESDASDALAGRRFAAVIFDLDQTLINSMPATVAAWTQWAIEHAITADQLTDLHGVRTSDIVARLIPADDRDAALDRIRHLEVTTVEGTVALPGAAAALTVLHEHAAIATSSVAEVARVRIAAAGLTPPAVLVTGSDVTHGKPDPEPFLLAAQRLGVDPAQCLVVEDAPAGIAAARASGAASLGVLTTTPAARLGADLMVADLGQVRFTVDPDGITVTPA